MADQFVQTVLNVHKYQYPGDRHTWSNYTAIWCRISTVEIAKSASYAYHAQVQWCDSTHVGNWIRFGDDTRFFIAWCLNRDYIDVTRLHLIAMWSAFTSVGSPVNHEEILLSSVYSRCAITTQRFDFCII